VFLLSLVLSILLFRYIAHPHAGDKWCIYPTYDYTHCIIDSLEHIDYSICTLEFETRRESYYWVLEALELYRPKVYEMSRLNISYTVLSKRKLLKLVMNGYMRGWDDPRMPTIKGLKRRGYSKAILNSFCNDIGVTRNANIVQYERLAATARTLLNDSSPRVMGILNPIRIELEGNGIEEGKEIMIPNYPFDLTRGNHTMKMEKTLFIDRSDFRIMDDPNYFGLAGDGMKMILLKYIGKRIVCNSYETNENGDVTLLKCSIVPEEERKDEKVRGTLTWIPASFAIPIEVRLYNPLFIVEEPDDETWEEELNPESEVVLKNALVDSSFLHYLEPEKHVQFERIGYFILDKDSDIHKDNMKKSKIVLNLTVGLKDSKPAPPANATVAGGDASGVAHVNRSRKEEQERQLAEKMVRRSSNATIPFTNSFLFCFVSLF
jgi:glutaminyl-tRNA synthetase